MKSLFSRSHPELPFLNGEIIYYILLGLQKKGLQQNQTKPTPQALWFIFNKTFEKRPFMHELFN